jgi:CRP-like cAMP-binding protein
LEAVQLLRDIPFLVGLSESELSALASSLRKRRFRRNEMLFHKDDPGGALYIILSGSVKVFLRADDGREVTLTLLKPGDFVGELALIDGEPRSADAIAVDPTEVYVLPRAAFISFVEGNAAAAMRLLAAFVKHYVRRLTETVHDAAFLDVPARLSRVLVQLLGDAPTTAGGSILNITQTDLAAMIGATRESVNKWLGYYERQGWVKRERGSVRVLDRDALAKQTR